MVYHKNTEEAYTNVLKSIGKKVGLAAIFADISRKGSFSTEASIQMAAMHAKKIVLKKITKKKDKI